MPPVRIAVVGLGWVATHRHIPALQANRDARIVGVVDRSGEKAERISRSLRLNRFAAVDSIAAIPWLDEVDAVTIATNPTTHFQLIHQALEAGKSVLTEKPFTMTLDEGQQLAELATSRSGLLAVVHNFQFATSTRRFLRDLKSGRLGRVNGILATQLGNPRRRLPVWYEQLPFGLFYDESPHFFYLLERLAPGALRFETAHVHPSTTGLATPATIGANYSCTTEDGRVLPVTMFLDFESPVSEWHIIVMTDRALCDLDVFRDIYVRLPNDGLHTTRTVIRTSLSATWQHWRQHVDRGALHLTKGIDYGNREVMRRFITAIRTGREPKRICASDALRILRRQHEILEKRRLIDD